MEARIVRLRTHQKNIDRYEGLLQTKLSDAERQYIEKRLSEERLAMVMLQLPKCPIKGEKPSSFPDKGTLLGQGPALYFCRT
jgi:hypothetical protein